MRRFSDCSPAMAAIAKMAIFCYLLSFLKFDEIKTCFTRPIRLMTCNIELPGLNSPKGMRLFLSMTVKLQSMQSAILLELNTSKFTHSHIYTPLIRDGVAKSVCAIMRIRFPKFICLIADLGPNRTCIKKLNVSLQCRQIEHYQA